MGENCKTCKYFIRHYIKAGRRFDLIESGHCIYPRLKDRRIYTPACEHYCESGMPEQVPGTCPEK